MNWRERIKGSFENIEHIEYGGEKVQSIDNNNKNNILKDYLRDCTLYTQNTQKPQKCEVESTSKAKDQIIPQVTQAQNFPDPDTHQAAILPERENKPPTPAQKMPAPEPPGIGPEYERIWDQAWTLAEWIDDPDGASIEDRRAKLPKLDDLRERMAEIVESGTNVPKSKNPTTTTDSKEIKQIKPPGTWHTWEPTGATTRDRSVGTCPAKCERSGKCFAGAYFKGKPGPVKDCEPEGCRHISSERGSHDSQTT